MGNEDEKHGALLLSQSKSEDNWLQDSMNESTSEVFKTTREEVRELKILRRKGYKDFVDAYHEYVQLKKEEGSLDYTLKEFCEQKGVIYRFPK
ncbi:MAG: hypothetical protein HOF21_09050 [Nitrospina sp.]|jgi:hypothetical protein|nr:hypothetical protein [Nitrospina sp.]MBT5631655.1 hypothetical protein [Nitrospina sp.]